MSVVSRLHLQFLSDMTREILTLQIGNQSNNIGVHFWNQFYLEQHHENSLIDYNTYFTFNPKTNLPSPRVFIVDYRNTFGYLLDESEEKYRTNDPAVEVINRPMENDFWPKRLKTNAKFHSKSLFPLIDYWYKSSNEENQFDIYPIGEQVFKRSFDQIENSLRSQLESCDSLQSFRCLYDINSSFSGLFTSIQDYLHEECPKQPIWSFGIGEKSSLLNLCLSLTHSLNENQMPTLTCLDPTADYQLGLAIQHSLFSSVTSLDILADRLCPMKKNLLHLSYRIPFEMETEYFYNFLEKTDLFQMSNPLACHYFIRGIEQHQLYNQSLHRLNIPTSGELLSTFFQEQYGSKLYISTDSWKDKYDQMNILTGLINDENTSLNFLGKLIEDMKKINWKTLSKRWQENSFDEQDFEQLIDQLNCLHEEYQ